MKHLFFVHSSITAIVAELIINQEQIPTDDVLVLLDRGATFNSKYKSIKWLYTWPPEPFPFHYSIIKSIKKLFVFDNYIKKITEGEPFILSAPHTNLRFIQLFITHSQCKGFNIMEEGLGSYKSKDTRDKANYKLNLHSKLCYLFRMKSFKFIQDGYTNLYSISSEAFPGYDRRIVLDIKKLDNYNNSYQNYNNSIILVFDAISVFNGTKIQNHIEAFLKLIKYFEKQKYDKIYFKFHPAQLGKTEEYSFREIMDLNDKIKFEEIPLNVSLEEVAKNCRNVKFYINVSSVGYYAKLFGQQVYSYAYYLTNFDPNYIEYVNSFPPVFKNSVTFI